jgi:hypothetical protein
MPNDIDRAFIDRATAELIRQSRRQSFQVAIMYDEGTIAASTMPTTTYTAQAARDLQYARQYLASPAYLTINAKPVIFVFAYEQVEPYVRWSDIRAQLDVDIILLGNNLNPQDAAHDEQYDGHYAWVQPTYPPGWRSDGMEWGAGYLHWFYTTMASPTYARKIMVGGVWPGFDDTHASWGNDRYMRRRCGQTWRDTWRLAEEYNSQIVLIATYNDFEEGTAIEDGVGECFFLPT